METNWWTFLHFTVGLCSFHRPVPAFCFCYMHVCPSLLFCKWKRALRVVHVVVGRRKRRAVASGYFWVIILHMVIFFNKVVVKYLLYLEMPDLRNGIALISPSLLISLISAFVFYSHCLQLGALCYIKTYNGKMEEVRVRVMVDLV